MMTNTNNAAAASEYRSNIGHDYTLADAYDAEYMDLEPEADETAEELPEAMMLRGYSSKGLERVGPFVI